MRRSSFLPILFSLFFVFSLHSSSESPAPFSVNVLVEEGENVVGWEDGIFGKIVKKDEKKKEENKDLKKAENKTEEKETKQKEVQEVAEEESESEPEPKPELESELETDEDKKETEYGRNDPKWGRYYGDSSQIEQKHKPVDVEEKNEETEAVKAIVDSKEEEFIPIDILLWSQGGDGYLAMINTGVRVSYLNMYSTLSVGTDYSASIDRPMSLGVNLGGYYRIDDFLITADLGYEKIWDFGDNPELNDYALGLKAGLSYSIWNWFAISAGAGVNYNILKDSSFEKGKFSPMIFGGFEFNLMK